MEHIVLLLFSFFTEAVILWQYTSNLFTSSYGSKIRLALLSALYTILFLLSLLKQTGLNVVSFFVFNTVFLYVLFKLKLLLALFHSAIVTAIMGISEIAVLGIISRFFPHFLLETDAGLVFYTVFSKIFFFAVIYLLIHLFKGKKLNQEQYGHSEILLMLIPVSSIFIIFTLLSIGETSAFAPPIDFLVTICAVFLLMVNLLVFGINQYNQKKSQEYADLQLLLQKESDSVEYYEMMLAQNENQSILIHDIKKHLQSIKLLNEKHDSDKINAYIQQLMESSDLRETTNICDNEMLNAILCRYQRQCNDKHIHFHTDIRSGTVQYIYQHDLTSLFCNLLENAMESAENIPDSFIELTVQKKENSPFVIIILINSCQNTPVYNQEGVPVSHKSDNGRHGFGIKSIKKVVKQYHGNLQMYYDNDSGTFHTIITLKQ
ncbi:GHKL domain-containing protein [Blautia schinkii]|uniref:sensor histidine kinase n=1 Tax=Blautia schinkii TaxID=180164 RepID=UPI00156E6427|nr:sensor histidine kinase [Blautia schinkii]NSG83607.1 GHKL domain-containing protein [Blautia schinkii]NSK24215.1 GHKL domain-containing protein [Blautia schinkii]NSK27252.1 GHKL domain-containing protein [Blautia schinkii]NSK33608.1 GHKL domain-containing protein [Blautia schinkii]NSK35810.1 GHKL domain-containing protein [Blautia schinkii]